MDTFHVYVLVVRESMQDRFCEQKVGLREKPPRKSTVETLGRYKYTDLGVPEKCISAPVSEVGFRPVHEYAPASLRHHGYWGRGMLCWPFPANTGVWGRQEEDAEEMGGSISGWGVGRDRAFPWVGMQGAGGRAQIQQLYQVQVYHWTARSSLWL